jgi:membrane fusion protein
VSGLFREQVIQRQRQRVHGSIVIDTPVSGRVVTVVACTMLAAVVAFLCLASITRTEEVAGQLMPDTGMLQVTVPHRGVVVDVRVRSGQVVAAGDVLAVLSGELTTAKGETQRAVSSLMEQRLASLGMESQQLASYFESKQAALRERKRGLTEELRQIQAEVRLLERRGDLALEDERRMQALQEQGFVTSALVQERTADALDQAARLAASRRGLAEVRARLEQALADERELPLQVLRDREQQQRAADELRQQQVENESRRELLVRAPQAGRVVGVAVRQGQSVAADAPVASLVPEDSALQAELDVPSRSIAFVRVGTPVWLRYDAYPAAMFGQHVGTVVRIDVGVATADGRVTHRVLVQLGSQQLNVAEGQRYPLMPGLAVNASLRLEERRLVEWLFAPLKRWAVPQNGKLT